MNRDHIIDYIRTNKYTSELSLLIEHLFDDLGTIKDNENKVVSLAVVAAILGGQAWNDIHKLI